MKRKLAIGLMAVGIGAVMMGVLYLEIARN